MEVARAFAWEQVPWSDWSEHGGRYTDYLPKVHEHDIPAVACYLERPTECDALLTALSSNMERDLGTLLARVGHLTVREVYDRLASPRTYEHDAPFTQDLYVAQDARRVLNLANGQEHHADTLVYDVMEWYAGLRYFRERTVNNAGRQFLVVWDFHF